MPCSFEQGIFVFKMTIYLEKCVATLYNITKGRKNMRLTVAQLRKIIKEEVSRMLVEGDEPMFEARGETAKNREAILKKQIQKLQKELEASMGKKRQTREDEDEQERLESELDELEKELLVVRDPSMKESRRRR